MRVFCALLLDAYRELNSRKLFWIVLALSALFIIVYASIGFDETGIFMFYGLKHVDSELIRADTPMAALLYRGIFATFVVPIWLAWIATILALISTAPIFPEFVSGGSIDLILCKPISRLRVFLYKYLASLLFVVLQVTVFCTGVFVAMGWRLGDWNWKVFAAVPLITVFYSCLYSFCVLIGVWTRSTLAALLLTMLMWFGLFTINKTEEVVIFVRSQMDAQVERLDRQIERARGQEDQKSQAERIASLETERNEQRDNVESINRWVDRVRLIQLPLPKTRDTINLLDRMLAREGDINLMDLITGQVFVGPDGKPIKRESMDEDRQAENKMMEEMDRNSAVYILGTSLAFEFVVLGIAAFIFCRRDY